MLIQDVWFDLKDGRKALLRSPLAEDAQGTLDYLVTAAGETDFLLSYPEEFGRFTLEGERAFLQQKKASDCEAMILCLVEGKIVGDCTLTFNNLIKTRHRAEIGIAILKDYWNQGIGTRMFQEMIRLAKAREGVMQLELDFVEGNARARALYEKMGFRITGVRPRAVRLKDGALLSEYHMIRDML